MNIGRNHVFNRLIVKKILYFLKIVFTFPVYMLLYPNSFYIGGKRYDDIFWSTIFTYTWIRILF